MKFPSFFEKILSIIQAEPFIYGLEISDAALRLAYFNGSSWSFKTERLTPGTLDGGQVKNKSEFVLALGRLKVQLPPKERDQKINVVVVMSSLHIYSQVFSLPVVKGESLEQAISLNLQMVSPIEASQTYAGWQIVGEDRKLRKVDVLSAFVVRSGADAITNALEEAGFLMVVLEPRALSLVRLVREESADVDVTKPYLIANVDDNGIDILVVRHGQLYFQYFNPWRELQEGKFMSLPMFENIVVRSFAQVLNFSSQHWQEPIKETYLFSIGLADRVSEIVKKNFSLTIHDLKLKSDQAVEPSWFVVAGAGLRGMVPRRNDFDLNLLGIEVQEKFRVQRLLSFAKFWRLLVPISLVALCFMFIGAEVFLRNVEKDVATQAGTSLQGERALEFSRLQAEAAAFNRVVSMVSAARSGASPKGVVFDKIISLTQTNGISITRLPFTGCGNVISLTGKAASQDKILEFKNALEKEASISQLVLPLTSIQQAPDNTYSFLVNFAMACATSS